MNASVGQINDYRARFGYADKCAVEGCGNTAVFGRYCGSCSEQLQALDQMYEDARARKARRREGNLYIRFALGLVRRFEWIGTLTVVSFCMALLILSFAPWFFDVARRFKDVLLWGK